MATVYLAHDSGTSARSRSRCCTPNSPPPSALSASSARSGRPPGSSTPTSCRARLRRSGRPALVHDALRRGRDLRDRLRREVSCRSRMRCRSPARWPTRWTTRTASGVVHRDIKPENILLSRGHALVADFGIAKALAGAAASTLTATGMAVGTPAYMSPEQAGGRRAWMAGATSTASAASCTRCSPASRPYTGPTPQAVIAKRVLEPLPHVRTLRAERAGGHRAGDQPGPRHGPGRPVYHRRRVRPCARLDRT